MIKAQRFEKWVTTPEKQLHRKIVNVLGAYTIVLIIISLVNLFYGWLYAYGDLGLPEKINISGQIPFFSYKYKHPFWVDFYGACAIAPLCEEIIFRVAPMRLLKLAKNYKSVLLTCMLFTSCVFGYMHQGSVSIPIQGVMGFVLVTVYIKNGYNYLSSVALHLLWNFTLLCGMFKYMS